MIGIAPIALPDFSLPVLHDPEMSAHQRALIAEKRKQFEDRSKKKH